MAPTSPGDEARLADASDDGDGGRPHVLCLFGRADSARPMELRVAAAIADGGKLLLSGDGGDPVVGRLRDSTSILASVDVEPLSPPGPASTDWIVDVVDEYDVSTVVDARRGVRPSDLGDVGARVDSTALTVRAPETIDSLSSLLVPVARGPHLDTVLDVARSLAESTDAWLDLFHVVDDADRPCDDADELLAYCADRLGGFEAYDDWLFEAADPGETIVEQSEYYDATVLGAAQKGELRKYVSGSTTDLVCDDAPNVVLTVHAGDVNASRLERWFGEGT